MYSINVYKIWYEDAPGDHYVGSTKEILSKRMTGHRASARKGESPVLYETMREKGVSHFRYCLLGSCMVRNKDQQRLYEQTWIDRLQPTLNMCRAYRTEEQNKQQRKEYKQRPDHKQQRKEYRERPEVKQQRKEYKQRPEVKQQNKKLRQRKLYCEFCNKSMVKHAIEYHCGTGRHKNNYKNKFREVFDMEITDEEVPRHL
jgi:hypothetical protein